MAWRRTGDNPLPEQMLTLFNDAYMRNYGGGGELNIYCKASLSNKRLLILDSKVNIITPLRFQREMTISMD